ncbi:hypothetical protein XBFM1_550030 [Xenorhabdus bovienii str. feltiae Moldova]|uniref:Uncharacterized protein n=1 Tax=Xenorhabdus bovienii str. feltiae Moldova TaxID=1398200 RepID=A0A077NXC2_XENBV|nr:hypothetical protein XBFM1_550030 [Xenorhabdus bovienii str. feltiae Moldova]
MSVIPQHSIKFYSHFSPSKLFPNKQTIFEHKIIYNKLDLNPLKYKYIRHFDYSHVFRGFYRLRIISNDNISGYIRVFRYHR